MFENGVYPYLRGISERQFETGELTPLQLIYGFATVASMNDLTLSLYFRGEKDQEEIGKIREILNENRMDLSLIRSAVPMMETVGDIDEICSLTRQAEEKASDSDLPYSAAVLINLISLPIPELETLKKGHDLQDVLEKSFVSSIAGSESAGEAKKKSGKEVLADLITKCAQLSEYLNEKMPGEREAVHLFVQNYFRCEVSALENEDRTVGGVMLFAGPPEAEQERMIYLAGKFLDMEVTYPGKPEEMWEILDKSPKLFILIDEMEAGRPEMFGFYNRVISEGASAVNISDQREVNYKQAIIVYTTNEGAELYEDRSRRFSSLPPISVLPYLHDVFEKKFTQDGVWQIPESVIRDLLSTFNSQNIILFNYPGIQSAIGAINRGISVCEKEISEKYDLMVRSDPRLLPLLLYSCNDVERWDSLVDTSGLVLKNEIYEVGRHLDNVSDTLASLQEIEFVVDTEDCDEATRALFEDDEEYTILYLGSSDDLGDVSLKEGVKVICCSDEESIMQKVTEGDVRFVLADISYSPYGEQKYLSIDDRKTVGMSVFELISKKLPCVPLYVAEKEDFAKHDEDVLIERGARGFVKMDDPARISDRLHEIGNTLYLQRKADELSAHRMTLKYNTSQRISDNADYAEIRFYDFRIEKAEFTSGKYMINDAERPKEKFADVIGAEDAKKELQFFINYMKNPKPFMMNATQPPKGILLYGPPGTGKTMLARAMAAESEASFFAATGAGFADKWVGESEKNIRRLFATARKCAPSIIFIDEIDSIGKQRDGHDTHGEKELNTLIAEMDGFSQDPTRPVFVIAATNAGIDGESSNNGSVLDAALTRRFARSIKVDLPNKEERQKFLKMELSKLKACQVTDDGINSLADRTPGMSLALIKNVIDTAGRKAAMDQTPMDDDALMNALDEYKFGEEKKWDAETAWATAVHESGHAYINVLSGEKPSFVTIVSRGGFGGYMAHGDDEDKFGYNREDYLWMIRTSLAGRVAEMEFFGKEKGTNTGFSSDLQHATHYALRMICLLGMDDSRLYSLDPGTVLNSPLAGEVMDQVSRLLHDEMEETSRLVHEGRDRIEALATYLKDNNQATTEVIMECLGEVKKA